MHIKHDYTLFLISLFIINFIINISIDHFAGHGIQWFTDILISASVTTIFGVALYFKKM